MYDYENPRQYLLDALSARQAEDKNFSVRRWAQIMGLKSHSLLVMILQGKRKLRVQHVDFLAKGLGLTTVEEGFLKTLIQYDNAQTMEEKQLLSTFLNEMHPGENFEQKEIAEFKVVSNWVYMAIMAMTDLKDFRGTEEEIAERLKGRVSLTQVRAAIVRLMDLKLLEWNDQGNLEPTCNRLRTKDDVRDEGARQYIKQVSELAIKAVDEQELEDREFQSFTMAVSREKIPLAKEMIRRFRAQLSKAVSGNGDYVYQTNIQFFQLTQSLEQDSVHDSAGGRVAKDETSNNRGENQDV